MQTARFISLLFVTAVVLAGAWIVSVRNAPQTDIEQPPLFPSLMDNANEVAAITIRSSDQRTELALRDGRWVVANRGSYPALVDNVRRLVVNTAGLRIIEAKTRLPERYHRLAVEDVDSDGARSTELLMRNGEGEVLVNLIVGKERSSAIAGDNDALYVRPVGSEQALLVAGSPGVTARPSDWMNAIVADIDADRIRSITIRHADDERLRIERTTPEARDYRLLDTPPDMQVKSSALLSSLATAMKELRFDDVTAATGLSLPETPAVTATYRTFDGLIAQVRLFELDDARWAMLEFSMAGDADAGAAATTPAGPDESADPAAQASTWNARTQGWAYRLPTFKLNMMTKRNADLLQPARPEPASAGRPASDD